MGLQQDLATSVRSWRREVDLLAWETSKKAVFHKNLRITTDKKLRVEMSKRTTLHQRKNKNQQQEWVQRRKFLKLKRMKKYHHYLILGKTRHKLKINKHAVLRLEEITRKGAFYPEDIDSITEPEMHDLAASRYTTWKIQHLAKMWNYDNNIVLSKLPKARRTMTKHKKVRKKSKMFANHLFAKNIQKLSHSNLILPKQAYTLQLFLNRNNKLSFILNYIKRHANISLNYDKTEIKYSTDYQPFKLLNLY